MANFLQSALGVLLVSLIPLAGLLTLKVTKQTLEKYTHLLVSFAVGALLGNAFLHLLPEIFTADVNKTHMSLLLIGGVLLFYSLEQFLRWHHGHDTTDIHKKPVAFMSLIGDSVHNILDGLLIAGSFLVDVRLGWATVLAVTLHEIPQEIADFSILLHAKWPLNKIVLANIASGLLAFVGLLIGFVTNNTFPLFAQSSLALTAGGFVYIACTDLIPDLHQNGATSSRDRIWQLGAILLGIFLFILL